MSNNISNPRTIWIVSECEPDTSSIRYVCISESVALQKWNELREEMAEHNRRMAEYILSQGLSPTSCRRHMEELQKLKPGEECCFGYPDIEEWNVIE
jgi:hypothetical protein